MKSTLQELLAERSHLLVDGAMGTELFARGLTAGDPPEEWNLEIPDRVTDVHLGYIKAGSDVVLTNSFGGSAFRLKLHNLDDRVVEINRAAAEVARAAVDASDRPVLVAGSMGPTGELLEPMGALTPDSAAAAFADQAEGLTLGGADLLWVETMSSLDEAGAAIAGARSVSDLPIVVTMSYDTAGRTMMGVTGAQAVEHFVSLGVAGIGANCGNNLAQNEEAIAEILAGAGDIPVIIKANAGIPEFKGDELTYTGSPEIMAAHTKRMMDLGVRVIGGCCGTSTEHVELMRKTIDGVYQPEDLPAPGPAQMDRGERSGRESRRRGRRRG